jgi:hypothetical protein
MGPALPGVIPGGAERGRLRGRLTRNHLSGMGRSPDGKPPMLPDAAVTGSVRAMKA